MLLTITTTHRPATDLGYLLHKNPARFQSYDLSFGKAHVYYPQAGDERCTACLLLDVDPVGIVRGKGSAEGLLSQYVNDRPYVASSFLSVAISQVYGTALQGRCKDRPDLASAPIPLEARLDVPAGAGRRGVPAGGVRAPGVRRRVPAPPARRPLPGVGREPVLFGHDRRGSDALGPSDPPLRARAGLRQPEALLRRRRRDGEVAGEGGRLAGEASPEGGDRPPLPQVPAQPLPGRPSPGSWSRSIRSRPRGTILPSGRAEETLERPISLNEQRLGAVLASIRASGARRVLDLGLRRGQAAEGAAQGQAVRGDRRHGRVDPHAGKPHAIG